MAPNATAVVYLCWMPFGLDCFRGFLHSYKIFPAGANHDLIIVLKGEEDTAIYLQVLQENDTAFQVLHYTSTGLDIATYHWCADQLPHENLFFLNSRSRFLAVNWLAFFQTASTKHPKHIFGCTGSWQSYSSSVFTNENFAWKKTAVFKENFDKYKRMLKAATLWWYYFPVFPNPHLRTNAFFINRQVFLSLHFKPIISKMDAYRFESGRNGFSAQLKRLGYRLALLSKDGKFHDEKDWINSNIFWADQQQNLMIADNQTEIYKQADIAGRRLFNRLAWGRTI